MISYERYYDESDCMDYRQLSSKRQRAAKQYTCDMCRGVIPRNTYYYRTAYLHDGKFHMSRSHAGNALCGYEDDRKEE